MKNYLNLLQKEPKIISFGLLNSFFSGYGQTFFISLFIPYFLEEYSLSNSEFSSYYSALTIFSAFIMPYVGALIDEVDLRLYSLVIALFMLLSCLFIGFGIKNFYIFILCLTVIRFVGQGIFAHINTTATARYFDKDRGKALGLTTLGHPISEALLPPFVASLFLFMPWRQVFIVLSFVLLIFYFPLCLYFASGKKEFVSVEKIENKDSNKNSASRIDVLKSKVFLFNLLAYICPPFLLTGLFFHQALLAQSKLWSIQFLASSFVCFAIGRILGSIVGGPLVDRFTAVRMMKLYLFPFALGLLALYLINMSFSAYLYLGLTGLCVGIGGSVKSAIWAEVFGVSHLGAIKSMMTPIVVLSTAISPPVFAFLLDSGVTFENIILLSLFFVFISFFLSLFAKVRLEV